MQTITQGDVQLCLLVVRRSFSTTSLKKPLTHGFLFFSVIFCIGSVFQCSALRLTHLFIGRALGGVGVGALRLGRLYLFKFFFKPTLYNKSQYALSSLHGGNKPSGSTRFTHGSRTTLHRARCRIWVLDRLYYSF